MKIVLLETRECQVMYGLSCGTGYSRAGLYHPQDTREERPMPLTVLNACQRQNNTISLTR
ncbi:MAG: hypothetical protein ACSLEN_07740 [Candidatus Malihini olakiniferum]